MRWKKSQRLLKSNYLMTLFLCRRHPSARSGLPCTTSPQFCWNTSSFKLHFSCGSPWAFQIPWDSLNILLISLWALPSFSDTWIVWNICPTPKCEHLQSSNYTLPDPTDQQCPAQASEPSVDTACWGALCTHLHIRILIWEMGINSVSHRSSEYIRKPTEQNLASRECGITAHHSNPGRCGEGQAILTRANRKHSNRFQQQRDEVCPRLKSSLK